MKRSRALTLGVVFATILWSSIPAGLVQAASCNAASLTPVKYGQKGSAVTNVQACLIQAGSSIPAGATGYYGGQTKTAVVAFYKNTVNMTWDGMNLGPKGIAALKNAVSGSTGGSTTGGVDSATTAQLTVLLKALGMTDAQIAAVLASLGGTGSGNTGSGNTGTTVPGTLTVALDSSTPGSRVVPVSASNVELMKVMLTGTGNITSIAFKRTGPGATTDFSNVYLYDGDSRLTTGRTINSQTHTVTFTGLSLAVSGSKVLTLSADIYSSAGSNQHQFQLVSASDVTADTTVGGTFPLTSNTIGFSAASAGTATVEKTGSLANPNIGQVGAKLSEFKITAGSTEDIEVRRVALYYAGSLSRSNLTNLVLKQAGVTVATGVAINSKDLLVLTFTSPFAMEKGAVRTFELYGDISASAKSSETIKFYVDDSSDVYALGKQYGYGVGITRTGFDSDTSDHHVLTLQGGDITITFNGPAASDVAVRGQDVTVLDFTIASVNNVEIRNLRLGATTTLLDVSGEGFNDLKVKNQATGAVLTNSTDVTTSTSVVFTDPISIAAGQSIRMIVTTDIDSDDDASDTLRVNLNAFGASDIKNLDNNQYVAVANIVPNGVAGNLMTVKAPDLEISLAGSPASATTTAGASNVPLLAINAKAIADTIKITQLVFDGTNSSGSSTISSDLTSLGVYDGTTLVSTLKSVDSSTKKVTFDNLNINISQGAQKTLTVKASNLSTGASNGNNYYFTITPSTQVTAVDSNGNTLSGLSATVVNTGGTTKVGIATPSITFTKVTNVNVSDAGVVGGNGEVTFAEFDAYAQNGDALIKKFAVGVNNTATPEATTTLAEEVSALKVYINGTLKATQTPDGSGTYAGIARIENTSGIFTIPSNSTVRVTIKGQLNDIGNTGGKGASGSNVYAYLPATTTASFEATAGTQTLTDATGLGANAVGNQKVAYKAYPVITKLDIGTDKLSAAEHTLAKFRVTATGGEISFKKFGFLMTLTNATVSTSTGLKILRNGTELTTDVKSITAVTGGTSTIILSSEDTIASGSSADYEIKATFTTVPSANTASASAQMQIVSDAALITPTTYAAASTSYMVWSDKSAGGHSETTSDWANNKLLKTLTDTWIRSN